MTSQPEPPIGSVKPVPSGAEFRLAELSGWVRALLRVENAAALERMLCALALHPEGGGFDAVTILRRVPGLDLLELVRREESRTWNTTLLETLDTLAVPARAEEESQSGGIGLVPGELEGAAGLAWSRGIPVIGAAGFVATPWHGAGTVGAAALRREGEPWALLVVERREGLGDDQRAALESLVALAAEGLAALTQREESRRRGRQMAALAELSRACISTLNLAEVLRLATRQAMLGSGARGAATWRIGEDGRPRLEAVEGTPGWRERMAQGTAALAREVAERGQPRCAEPALDEPTLTPDVAADLSAIVLAPLTAYGRVHGVVAVFLAGTSSGTARDQLSFLSSLADLGGLALDQARRFEAAEQRERRLRDLGARLRREERRAAAGELALRAGAEARNPLASIGAFARRLMRQLGPEFAHRDYLEIIVRETERLERLLSEPAESAVPELPTLRLERLNDVVQDALQRSGEALVRRRVRLLKRLAPDLPPLLLDAARVRRAVENVLAHVLDVLPVGGRVRIESRVAGSHVTIEVAHDGPHAPGEVLDQLFVPFAAGRPGGPEIGLAVARQVVQEHGGEIRVRSEGEWSTLFSITFPVRGNQDRRKALPERRARRADRRGPATG